MKPLYIRLLIHLVVYSVIFFALPPYLENRTGTMSDLGALVMMLLMIIPAVILILSGEMGYREGLTLVPALLPALLFGIAVLTIFDGAVTGYSYALVYGILSLAANAAGAWINTKTARR